MNKIAVYFHDGRTFRVCDSVSFLSNGIVIAIWLGATIVERHYTSDVLRIVPIE